MPAVKNRLRTDLYTAMCSLITAAMLDVATYA